MKKICITALATAVIVGGAAFYGGQKYAQSTFNRQRQQRMQGFGTGTGTPSGSRIIQGRGGGFIGGQIIAKDNTSITVKAQDGGSRIIFYTGTTEIAKSVSGTSADLTIGNSVMVIGNPNSDGSITAQSIQIRPTLPQASPIPLK